MEVSCGNPPVLALNTTNKARIAGQLSKQMGTSGEQTLSEHERRSKIEYQGHCSDTPNISIREMLECRGAATLAECRVMQNGE